MAANLVTASGPTNAIQESLSYVATLRGPSQCFVTRNMAPKKLVKKGSIISIRINGEAYQKMIQLCQYALNGRLVLIKGDKPWKFSGLKDILQSLWKVVPWKLYRGKFSWEGFFQFHFGTKEDRNIVGQRVYGISNLGFSTFRSDH